MKAINLDAQLSNADWCKQTWDIPDITTEEQLKAYLKRKHITWGHFKVLPAYQGWLNRVKEPKP